ncbi:MAG: choloylglycine hydrolase [Ruminiclostridium sp.]|nr:choloylglycine hydrolase [Ruminiclostridium sp.]
MCTSISMNNGNFYFGRNMDIDYSFGERVIIMPRSFPISFKKVQAPEKHYAVIGMGTTEEGFPLYAEGGNETGLCISALKFNDNAVYSENEEAGKNNIAPYELIPWILGKCRSVTEAKKLLEETNIIGVPFNDKLPLSPLHWHIADKKESITVERTGEGMKIYDNPFGVLTNNPPFPFHSENASQYERLTPKFPTNAYIKPFGLGFGSIGLPGDFSPASRFIRAYFLLKNSACDSNNIAQLFHLLDNVAIPKGAVLTPDGKYHYTTYSCCIDTTNMTYYYKTYDGMSIKSVTADEKSINSHILSEIPIN